MQLPRVFRALQKAARILSLLPMVLLPLHVNGLGSLNPLDPEDSSSGRLEPNPERLGKRVSSLALYVGDPISFEEPEPALRRDGTVERHVDQVERLDERTSGAPAARDVGTTSRGPPGHARVLSVRLWPWTDSAVSPLSRLS